MKRTLSVQKQSGKVKVESVINGTNPQAHLTDTLFYQVGPHGDYVQECN